MYFGEKKVVTVQIHECNFHHQVGDTAGASEMGKYLIASPKISHTTAVNGASNQGWDVIMQVEAGQRPSH